MALRTTTGILVTGSIIKPRILTSRSIGPPRWTYLPGSTSRRPGSPVCLPISTDPACSSRRRPRGPSCIDLGALYLFADEGEGARGGDLHLAILSQKGALVRRKIYDAVARSAPGPLATGFMIAVDEDFKAAAEERLIARELDFALARVERGEAAALLFLGDSAGHIFRARVWARRIGERKNTVVLRGVEERKR